MPSTTRENIVETARGLFYRNGYTATGIARILSEAGVNSGSLYHFFPSKEDLLVAVLEKYKTMLASHVLEPCFRRVTDPVERIFGILEAYRRGLEESDFELGCPIGNLALEVGNDQVRARELITENFRAWTDAIREQIDAASARFPEGVDSHALANHVLVTMEGAVMLARAYRSFEPFDLAVKQLRDHFDRLTSDRSSIPGTKKENRA